MKKLIFIRAFCFLLVGCNERGKSDTMLNTADIHIDVAFNLEQQKSMNLYIEEYEYGHLKEDRLMNFGKEVTGKGKLELAVFRLGNPDDELFFIGAINEGKNSASARLVTPTPAIAWVTSNTNFNKLTKDTTEIIGAIGFFDEQSTPMSLQIDPARGEFVANYEKIKTVYVVVVDVR